jgi:3-oxoacyl-(acyl-carrier-protein) synthase
MMGGPLPSEGPPEVYDVLAPHFYGMQPFLYVHLVGRAFGFHGFSTSVHNACSSGAYALEVAAQCIRTGQATVMIVTGGEAFETGVRPEWFRRLELYAHDGRMHPFDPDSSGFYVGEGAGALVLESASRAEKRGVTPYAVQHMGAFAQQAQKQTVPDTRSGRLAGAITDAMKPCSTRPDEIDLIVPHGASTPLSDSYEADSIAQALGDGPHNAVATVFKPSLGHLLGASGLVEAICLLLAIRHQAVPATLGTPPERAGLAAPLITQYTERPINKALKLSTGFTGHDTAMLFSRV